MPDLDDQSRNARAWELAEAAHGVLELGELLALGFSRSAIKRRLASRRLHHTPYPGVYALGRPELTRRGNWLAAVKHCGELTALDGGSAAAFWSFGVERIGLIEISALTNRRVRHRGIRVHRRSLPPTRQLFVVQDSIPVTSPALTIIDMSRRLSKDGLDAMISKADVLGLTNPLELRRLAAEHSRIPGATRVRNHLDRQTFRLTRSKLERLFLPLVAALGMPAPLTRQFVNGFEVDFWWPELGLVVETDGLGFHRTPSRQAKDRIRDQAHTAAGLVPLRFIHAQVKWEPEHVKNTLGAVWRRLAA